MTRREWLIITITPVVLGIFIALSWQATEMPSSVSRRQAGRGATTAAEMRPSPDLKPQQVVKIIFEALRNNDTPDPDNGIKIVYRFASLKNRQITGPLDRFTRMIKTPQYMPMIMPNRVEYSPMRVQGDRAGQHIRITIGDRTVMYMIALTRQSAGKQAGCWMTDAVMVVAAGEAPKNQPQPIEQDGHATAI